MSFKKETTSSNNLDRMWSESWRATDIENKIKRIHSDENMRWKLKYLPSHGKILEAGCGLGQYVFYLNSMGFNVKGLDISSSAISACKKFALKNGIDDSIFGYGDVRNLDIQSNSISSYLSFGVIEHFKEGPEAALREAYRVLSPGGIAYFATPQKYNLSWLFSIAALPKATIRNSLIKLGLRKSEYKEWIEYHWTLGELKEYVESVGFHVVDASNTGIKASVRVGMRESRKYQNILYKKIRTKLFPFIDNYEDGFLSRFGVNNIIVALKAAKAMKCFYCGVYHDAHDLNLGKYSVPLCNGCVKVLDRRIVNNYLLGKKPFFDKREYMSVKKQSTTTCHYCSDKINTPKDFFGDLGFSVSVCRGCMRNSKINLELRNFNLKYIDLE